MLLLFQSNTSCEKRNQIEKLQQITCYNLAVNITKNRKVKYYKPKRHVYLNNVCPQNRSIMKVINPKSNWWKGNNKASSLGIKGSPLWSGHVTHCNAFLRPTDELQGFNTLPTDRRRIKVLKGFDATKTLVTRKYRFSNFYLFVCLTWQDLRGVPFKTSGISIMWLTYHKIYLL